MKLWRSITKVMAHGIDFRLIVIHTFEPTEFILHCPLNDMIKCITTPEEKIACSEMAWQEQSFNQYYSHRPCTLLFCWFCCNKKKKKKGNLINHNVQLFRFERNWDWHLSSSYTHMMKILHALPPMIRITRSWYNARYEPFNCFHILNFIFDDEIMQFGHKCILFPIRKYKMFATVTDDDYPRNNQFPFF